MSGVFKEKNRGMTVVFQQIKRLADNRGYSVRYIQQIQLIS